MVSDFFSGVLRSLFVTFCLLVEAFLYDVLRIAFFVRVFFFEVRIFFSFVYR